MSSKLPSKEIVIKLIKQFALSSSKVTNIKKTLKTTQQDMDDQMVADSREVPMTTEKPTKKASKSKG